MISPKKIMLSEFLRNESDFAMLNNKTKQKPTTTLLDIVWNPLCRFHYRIIEIILTSYRCGGSWQIVMVQLHVGFIMILKHKSFASL